jgi:hypothetical protein
MSLFSSYSEVPELTRFPASERKRIFNETVIRLRENDPEFQRKVDWYEKNRNWRLLVFVASVISFNQLLQREWLSGTIYLVLMWILTAVLSAVMVRFGCRYSRFLNEAVAAALREGDAQL